MPENATTKTTKASLSTRGAEAPRAAFPRGSVGTITSGLMHDLLTGKVSVQVVESILETA